MKPTDHDEEVSAQLFMLKALTSKLTLLEGMTFTLDTDVDLTAIARLTSGFGDAQLKRLRDVALNGVRRRVFFQLLEGYEPKVDEERLSHLLKVSQKELEAAANDVRLERDLELSTRETLQDLHERMFGDMVWQSFLASVQQKSD